MNVDELLRQNQESDLLRFTTAGSVDDGKSTLIGRLLSDCKGIYEDQLAALQRDSKRLNREEVDLALLMDGLKAAVANVADLLDRQLVLLCCPDTSEPTAWATRPGDSPTPSSG